jgi:hypothetical protein
MDPFVTLLSRDIDEARSPRVTGVVTAIVRRIEDGGAYYLDFLGMGDPDVESARARVVVPMAGADRGIHFLPEVGDEVVVAFESGDPNRPLILGAVWNRDGRPPAQAKQSPDNDVRTIVSRSGHEITFDDTSASESVVVRTQGGHEIVLDDTPGSGKIEAKTSSGHKLTLDDTPPGSATLATAGGCKITLSDAGGMVSVEAPAILNIKGQIVNIDATAINLKTTGVVTGSMVTIEGKPFGVHQHTFCPVNPSGPVVP